MYFCIYVHVHVRMRVCAGSSWTACTLTLCCVYMYMHVSLVFVIINFWLLQCLVTLGVVGRMAEQEGGAGSNFELEGSGSDQNQPTAGFS